MTNGNDGKTHCKHGHEFTEANTRNNVTAGRKYRTCRACEQLRNKRAVDDCRAYERRRVVSWLRANGFPGPADRIERCDHIIKRGRLARLTSVTQQQEQAS